MNHEYRHSTIVAGAGLAVLLFLPSLGFAQSGLGSAASFAVLAGSTITNTGATTINADVGVSPGTAITGLPAGQPTEGTIHAGDPVAAQAQDDLTTAYNLLASMACGTDMTGQDLGGKTLGPGVYCFSSSVPLTGTLTLDGQGDPGAEFVFQIGSTLTGADLSSVIMSNGAQNRHVWWQVGSSATLGISSSTQGNILASASITLNTGAVLSGRALAQTGAVTMDSNSITSPGDTATPTIRATWAMIKTRYR